MGNTLMRRTVLGTALVLGAVEFAGSIVWALGGAGIFGSPLQGGGSWPRLVVAFLIAGPMSLLPAAVCAIWRPRVAGTYLVIMAAVSSWFAVQVMTPPLETWSPGGENMSQYTFKWSLALILPFSLPLLAFGSWFLWVGRQQKRRDRTI